ncbi:antitoxin VbhA family protein [Psychrobacter sp. NPDC064578]|uniref:antitoxin VbhA family protein n=1 Tax=Psychrobacter sp. NPDC064578 TaxID=3364493 RepID=UPI00384F606C
MKDNKSEKPIIYDRAVLVSQDEIAKRRHANAITAGSFSVGNFSVNPDTQHIFEDFVEGRIATIEEVYELLHAHYTELVLKDN